MNSSANGATTDTITDLDNFDNGYDNGSNFDNVRFDRPKCEAMGRLTKVLTQFSSCEYVGGVSRGCERDGRTYKGLFIGAPTLFSTTDTNISEEL